MSDEIEWGDPPPVKKDQPRSTVWADRLAPFREHPGEWGRLGRYHAATANKIRRGYFFGVEEGAFEVTLRDIARGGDTKGDLYVRYIGEPSKIRAGG